MDEETHGHLYFCSRLWVGAVPRVTDWWEKETNSVLRVVFMSTGRMISTAYSAEKLSADVTCKSKCEIGTKVK